MLIVAWEGREDLRACLKSLHEHNPQNVRQRVIVVDNGSTDGSAEMVRNELAEVHLIEAGENLGFTGGNNLAWEAAQRLSPQAEFVVLLNQDTVVRAGWLDALAGFLQQNPAATCAQAKLLLFDRPDTLNTAGNRSHYLGFGFVQSLGEPDGPRYCSPREIDYPSGAAVMLRAEAVRQMGLFDGWMFLHLEDADLGWKFRQAGGSVWFAPQSVVLHRYRPTAPLKHYFYLERNRWVLLLTYYRWRTLALLFPALLAMELGQALFALQNGLMGERMRVYRSLASGQVRGNIARRRRLARARRTLSDREFLGNFAGRIVLPTGNPWLLRWVANPLLDLYWRCVRVFLFW